MSTERLSKRLRSCPPPAPDEARNYYFDTVPDDILRIVLRYLSRRPQSRHWHRNIAAESVNTTLDVGGALGRAALMEFNIVGGENGIPPGNLDLTILRPLVYRLALRRLVLRISRNAGVDLLTYIIPGCGAELRELVLDYGNMMMTENEVVAISKHCTKLSWLEIGGRCIQGTLAPIWCSLGPTLTRIYIGRQYGRNVWDVFSVPDLVKHCVNLYRVDVKVMDYEMSRILATLGSRIRVLSVEQRYSYASISHWHTVYEACTNLEAVHLSLHSPRGASDILSLLSTKLVFLVPCARGTDIDDVFLSALSRCSQLKEVELNLFGIEPEVLRKLFESLKSVTTMTCWTGRTLVDLKRDIIDVIACNLTNLESLTISTYMTLDGGHVDALVDLLHLKSVTLRRDNTLSSNFKFAEGRAVEVVNTFNHCAQLSQLEIDNVHLKKRSQLIAEAAVTYDRKDFDMFIGGVQYRTW